MRYAAPREVSAPEECRGLVSHQRNAARHDLTGNQRKQYGAEIGRLIKKLADDSNLQNLKNLWIDEILKRLGIREHRVGHVIRLGGIGGGYFP